MEGERERNGHMIHVSRDRKKRGEKGGPGRESNPGPRAWGEPPGPPFRGPDFFRSFIRSAYHTTRPPGPGGWLGLETRVLELELEGPEVELRLESRSNIRY